MPSKTNVLSQYRVVSVIQLINKKDGAFDKVSRSFETAHTPPTSRADSLLSNHLQDDIRIMESFAIMTGAFSTLPFPSSLTLTRK